jgi:hypothetical protein
MTKRCNWILIIAGGFNTNIANINVPSSVIRLIYDSELLRTRTVEKTEHDREIIQCYYYYEVAEWEDL